MTVYGFITATFHHVSEEEKEQKQLPSFRRRIFLFMIGVGPTGNAAFIIHPALGLLHHFNFP